MLPVEDQGLARVRNILEGEHLALVFVGQPEDGTRTVDLPVCHCIGQRDPPPEFRKILKVSFVLIVVNFRVFTRL